MLKRFRLSLAEPAPVSNREISPALQASVFTKENPHRLAKALRQ